MLPPQLLSLLISVIYLLHKIFLGPICCQTYFWRPFRETKIFRGQVCQGPICQSPICRDPICRVQFTSKKCPRPDLPRILRIVRPFACLSVLKKISLSFFSSSFAFFGQSCQRHHPHHPLTNITPGCDFYFRLAFGWF